MTLLLFTLVPARRAVLISSIAGWLILPRFTIPLPGVPDYTKTSAVVLGILLGIVVFDTVRLTTFRPRWCYIQMIIFCISPFCSAISNDLGPYDGLSAAGTQCVEWLLPYWIGRMYFIDVESYRELGLGMVICSICLIPFCLFELKMSAILQGLVYGGGGTWERARMGSYRPRVFFASGLALGLWMKRYELGCVVVPVDCSVQEIGTVRCWIGYRCIVDHSNFVQSYWRDRASCNWLRRDVDLLAY